MSVDINTHPATVIRTVPVSQILTKPDFHLSTFCQVHRTFIVGEHKFIGVQSVSERKVVPKATVFDVFFIWEDNVVASIRHHNIQWIFYEAWMVITTPVTVESGVLHATHSSATPNKFNCSEQLSIPEIVK